MADKEQRARSKKCSSLRQSRRSEKFTTDKRLRTAIMLWKQKGVSSFWSSLTQAIRCWGTNEKKQLILFSEPSGSAFGERVLELNWPWIYQQTPRHVIYYFIWPPTWFALKTKNRCKQDPFVAEEGLHFSGQVVWHAEGPRLKLWYLQLLSSQMEGGKKDHSLRTHCQGKWWWPLV